MSSSARSLPGWLLLMGVLTMTAPIAIDMYLPAFPAMTTMLGAPGGAVERTLAIYLVGMGLGQLIYGPFSDRYGRKPPLYVGLVLFSIASLGCATATSIESLTAWRLVQALGGSVCMVVPRAVIRDHYSTQAAARAMSLMMLIIGVAPMLAPIIGAQILRVATWQAIFAVQAVFGLGLLLAMHFAMTESLVRNPALRLSWRSIGGTYASLLRHKQFMSLAMAGGFGMGGMFAYVIGSPHAIIEVYGVSPQTYSILFAVNALSMIIASQVNGRLLIHRHPSTLMRRALWLMPTVTVSSFVLALTGLLPLWLLLACLMGMMACQGFVGPNSAALALSQQSGRLGAASALLGTVQFACATVIGLGVSVLRTDDASGLTAMLALCGILACFFGRKGLALTIAEPAVRA